VWKYLIKIDLKEEMVLKAISEFRIDERKIIDGLIIEFKFIINCDKILEIKCIQVCFFFCVKFIFGLLILSINDVMI